MMRFMLKVIEWGDDMHSVYPNIDMMASGERIHKAIIEKGFTVKDIQEYLHLSCPQPVYRWFNGQIMPSLDHVYALSQLLHVHMEDLLVQRVQVDWIYYDAKGKRKRFVAYYQRMSCAA